MKKTTPPKTFLEAFALYGGAGFQLSFCVVAGLYVGNWADNRWNTTPWLLITGLLLGAIAGFVNLIRIVSFKDEGNK